MPLMSLLISGNSAQIVPTCWLQMFIAVGKRVVVRDEQTPSFKFARTPK